MVDVNPNLSNGTCYVDARTLPAKIDLLPCGNVATGQHYACCSPGDNCLSSNACFNMDTGITYIAGCTDPIFGIRSGACTQKHEYTDQDWVGLVTCLDSDAHKHDETLWAGCKEAADGGFENGNKTCLCGDQDPLFRATSLTAMGALPTSMGSSISWYSGFSHTYDASTAADASSSVTVTEDASATEEASTTDIPTSAPTGGPSSLPSDSAPSSEPIAAPSAEPTQSGLPTGTKAGIGVGAGVGSIILACLVAVLVMFRKRKRKHQFPRAESPPPLPQDTFGDTGRAVGFKSELPADEPKTAFPSTASPNPSSYTVSQPRVQQLQAYDTRAHADNDRYSNISGTSGSQTGHEPVGAVSPQTMSGQDHGGGFGQTTMQPIHELA
ncbi:hypothetical protein F5Y15DRAFT_376035 [Xylariaceae sp. FL0016]|nr:hypothetical protein F5Y15DRAFT_376035 [Xylariaceae sp. FL0016]